jgi:hypothetical protein
MKNTTKAYQRLGAFSGTGGCEKIDFADFVGV